jgi:hypothetical protein
MGLLPDPVSPVVAVDSFRSGILLVGLATAPEKGRFKVAHYPSFAFIALTVLLGDNQLGLLLGLPALT